MTRSASLIAVSGGNYLLQTKDLADTKFIDGEYPFIFPGAFAFFGGGLEEGENAEQGFIREVLDEELPGLIIKAMPEHRQYDWSKQIDEVLERVNKTLHGNVCGLLGFDLNAYVPQCALGKNRGKNLTYREWIGMITEDNFYICNLAPEDLEGIVVREGSKLWLPHSAVRALVMVPTDKLAFLDDYAKRINSGEIKL